MPVVPAGSPANSPAVLEAEAAVAGDEPMVDAAAQDIGAETDTQDVRQVASDILRRGVELRYCKLFPQLKFYFTFYSSYKFP